QKYNPLLPDRSMEAEWMAFAAVGGSSSAGAPVGALGGGGPGGGAGPPPRRGGPGGRTPGPLSPRGASGGGAPPHCAPARRTGGPSSGVNRPINAGGATLAAGTPVPEGWLVLPHDGAGITAAEVTRIINQGVAEANLTRAAIRLPLESRTRMVLAVTDLNGDVVGLFRM